MARPFSAFASRWSAVWLICLIAGAQPNSTHGGEGDLSASQKSPDNVHRLIQPTTLPQDADLEAYREELYSLRVHTASQAQKFQGLRDPGDVELEKVHAEVKRIQVDLDNLKRTEAGQNQQAPAASTTPELEKKLKELLDRITTLRQELDNRKKSALPPPLQSNVGKQVIGFMLVGRQVVPFGEPYIQFKRGFIKDAAGNNRAAVQVSRINDGEPIDAAIKESGTIAKALQGTDSTSYVVAFLVCADAIDTFRQARRFVAGKGFSYSWNTGRDQPFIRVVDGSNQAGALDVTPPGSR